MLFPPGCALRAMRGRDGHGILRLGSFSFGAGPGRVFGFVLGLLRSKI
jgi:hypothetical protein